MASTWTLREAQASHTKWRLLPYSSDSVLMVSMMQSTLYLEHTGSIGPAPKQVETYLFSSQEPRLTKSCEESTTGGIWNVKETKLPLPSPHKRESPSRDKGEMMHKCSEGREALPPTSM